MEPDEEPIVRRICEEIEDGRVIADRPPGWHGEHPTLVAEVDGRAVGYTTYYVEQGCMVWVETAVTAAYRGRGIGRALMEARLAIARELGCRAVAAGATDDNAPMVHLLTSFGLTPRQPMPGHPDLILYAGVL